MGSGGSKPDSVPGQHVFESDKTPVRFSGGLVDSLQGSTQSDRTRSKDLEYQIQKRVTSELERLQAAESSKFSQIAERASDETPAPQKDDPFEWRRKALYGEVEQPKKQEADHDSVNAEIEALKKKLEGRRKLDKADEDVEKARDEVVQCLRLNDRRPLDCWKEVETFRQEVGKLERLFVEKTLR